MSADDLLLIIQEKIEIENKVTTLQDFLRKYAPDNQFVNVKVEPNNGKELLVRLTAEISHVMGIDPTKLKAMASPLRAKAQAHEPIAVKPQDDSMQQFVKDAKLREQNIAWWDHFQRCKNKYEQLAKAYSIDPADVVKQLREIHTTKAEKFDYAREQAFWVNELLSGDEIGIKPDRAIHLLNWLLKTNFNTMANESNWMRTVTELSQEEGEIFRFEHGDKLVNMTESLFALKGKLAETNRKMINFNGNTVAGAGVKRVPREDKRIFKPEAFHEKLEIALEGAGYSVPVVDGRVDLDDFYRATTDLQAQMASAKAAFEQLQGQMNALLARRPNYNNSNNNANNANNYNNNNNNSNFTNGNGRNGRRNNANRQTQSFPPGYGNGQGHGQGQGQGYGGQGYGGQGYGGQGQGQGYGGQGQGQGQQGQRSYQQGQGYYPVQKGAGEDNLINTNNQACANSASS